MEKKEEIVNVTPEKDNNEVTIEKNKEMKKRTRDDIADNNDTSNKNDENGTNATGKNEDTNKKIKLDTTSDATTQDETKDVEKVENTDVKKDGEDKESKGDVKESKTEDKPKYVFGAKTSFGFGFNINKDLTNNNTDGGINSKDKSTNNAFTSSSSSSTSSSASKPFTFGSKFSFGSGFDVLKQKKEDVEEKKDDASDSGSRNKINNDEFQRKEEKEIIKLHKQDVKSGEESEECIMQINAKLYQLNNIKDGWKERGVGTLKLNKDKTTSHSRIVMRSRGILKVILNLPLVKGYTIKKGFPGSLQGEKFIRILAVDDNNSPVTYALKAGNSDIIDDLYDNINKLIE